MVLIYLHKKN